MSLNVQERQRVTEELRANIERSGVSRRQICSDLHFSEAQLNAAIAMSDRNRPTDIWLLRDYLEREIRESGREPVPFTVLTEQARTRVRLWLDLEPLPPRRA